MHTRFVLQAVATAVRNRLRTTLEGVAMLNRSLRSLILVLTPIVISCSSPAPDSVFETSEETTKQLLPEKGSDLLDRLNAWDKDEIDAYERPAKYPNYDVKGESGGYIEDCKARLKGLGIEVKWNPNKLRYEPVVIDPRQVGKGKGSLPQVENDGVRPPVRYTGAWRSWHENGSA